MRSDEALDNTMTQGVIWKQLLNFFFPILLGTFFQQLYNTVDAIIVGQFVGKEALAAVGGATGTLINLLVGFFVGLSSGATVIISQYYGARRGEDTSKAVHTSMALGVVGGVALTLIGLLVSPWALRAMGTPDEILVHALTYIRVYFSGTIFSLLYNIGSGILRAVGDSKRPLYILIVCCLVNLALDLVFVVWMKMGVLGAALATFLSQLISAALVLFCLLRSDQVYRLYFKEIRFHPEILREIITIGFPAGLQSVLYSISNVMIQASINSFGTDIIAAWTAYGKIDSIFWMILTAFGVAITTFAGQNFGAQQYDRIRKGVWVCSGMAAATSAGLSLLLILTSQYLYRLFTDDPVVIELGIEILNTLTPFYITFVLIEMLSGAARGAGDSLIPTIITCFGVCVLRVAWILIAVPLYPDVKTVIYSYPITWILTSVLFLIYYLQGGWLRRRIAKAGFPPEERKPRHKTT